MGLTVQKLNELVTSHRRSYFDSYWVADASKILDMGAIKLTSTIADPDKMRRSVVIPLGSCNRRLGATQTRGTRLTGSWGSAVASISIKIGSPTSRGRNV